MIIMCISGKRASMILFLSDYRKSKEFEYKYDKNNLKFTGEQTNDAPAKCLLKMAKDNGEIINKIFCIVSKKVYCDDIEDGIKKTSFERFSDMIKEYSIEELGNNDIEIIPIRYNFEFCDNDVSEIDNVKKLENSSVHIYEEIENNLNQIEKNNKQSIYIDYTGGFRDISFLMTAIIRYLEFRGNICKEIVYSKFDEKKIYSIYYIYNIFEMINGVSEFANTGNAKFLADFSNSLRNNNIIYEKINNFIESIQNFSDAMSICNINDIDKTLNAIIKEITELENDEGNDIIIQMFKTLIPTVKEKMYVKKGKISYLDLSKWCLNNNMLQQALTIYNEKIIDLYYEKLSLFDEEINKVFEMDIDFKNLLNQKDKIENKNSKFPIIKEALNNINNRYKKNRIPKNLKNKFKSFKDFINGFLNKDILCRKELKKEIKNSIKMTIVLDYIEINDNKLWEAMKYYHIIRIMRNNINHASGKFSKMNMATKKYLEEKGLEGNIFKFIGDDVKVSEKREFIHNTLLSAIKYSEKLLYEI